MSNNTGPASRSNRRRMSAEYNPPLTAEDPSTSPVFMNGHSLFRGAPSTGGATHWSPAAAAMAGTTTNNPSARRQRRFFENSDGADGGGSAGSQQQRRRSKEGMFPSSTNLPSVVRQSDNHNTANNNKNRSDGEAVMDGINVEKLRALTKEALGTPAVSSLPSTSVFYASLLYAKTQSQEDCFLYAQALSRNGESKRCVRLLEQSGILDPLGSSPPLRLEAVLLAAEALSVLGEWQGVLELLEDASQLVISTGCNVSNRSQSHPSQGQHQCFQLEDDDDMAWDSIFKSVEQPKHYIHPVSRLCLWRGRAYAETGHPQRAAIYWQRAIRMDSKCVQALDLLLARSVVTPQEAYEIIENLNMEAPMEWLRDLYLARIELSPQDVHDKTGGSADHHHTNTSYHCAQTTDVNMQNMPSDTPSFAMEGHSQYLDASSIQMASPSLMNSPRGDTATTPTDPSFQNILGSSDDGINNAKKNSATSGVQFAYNTKDRSSGYADKKLPAKSPVQVHVDEAFAKLWNVHKLHQSPEVLSMAARRAYRRYDLRGALEHCQQLATIDPLCQTAGYVYISTLAALGHKRHLFRLAHEWVEASPKSARAWFAVGSYYYACERYHVAQRHFCRATRLDPHCTEAWIAFGCSFAACDESDQALASFRAAQRLSPGEYASLLYMGMEYLRTNHLVLAQYFLSSAFKASGGDPLCLNELGVLSIQRSDYEGAIGWFSRALRACVQDEFEGDDRKSVADCIVLCQEPHWEATIFNLGQCYRKTRKFTEASRCFERCIALSPEKCSGYAALAFTKHLMGDLDEAIDFYHQALSCKPDDPFSSEMLNKALTEALSTSLTLGEDENHKPPQEKVHPTANGASVRLKNRMIGHDQTFLSNTHANTSTSMMSDDGLNLESDVDMSMA